MGFWMRWQELIFEQLVAIVIGIVVAQGIYTCYCWYTQAVRFHECVVCGRVPLLVWEELTIFSVVLHVVMW